MMKFFYICRVRTWSSSTDLLFFGSKGMRDSLKFYLSDGHLCVRLQIKSSRSVDISMDTTVCLAEVKANDGKWHDVHSYR